MAEHADRVLAHGPRRKPEYPLTADPQVVLPTHVFPRLPRIQVLPAVHLDMHALRLEQGIEITPPPRTVPPHRLPGRGGKAEPPAEPYEINLRKRMRSALRVPHRLHNEVRSAYMHVDGEVVFEPVAGGTRLRWDWDMRLVGWMRPLSPVLAVVGPRWERRNWVGLKHHLESGGH